MTTEEEDDRSIEATRIPIIHFLRNWLEEQSAACLICNPKKRRNFFLLLFLDWPFYQRFTSQIRPGDGRWRLKASIVFLGLLSSRVRTQSSPKKPRASLWKRPLLKRAAAAPWGAMKKFGFFTAAGRFSPTIDASYIIYDTQNTAYYPQLAAVWEAEKCSIFPRGKDFFKMILCRVFWVFGSRGWNFLCPLSHRFISSSI